MIQYYIDGSTKENMIGVGIVRVNEFGFIEKHHFNIEHINPSSQLAEGYSLEKTFEMIKEKDFFKNELIDIYTDCQQLYHSLMHQNHIEFNRSNFFAKQETNPYFQFLRNEYRELNSKYSSYPVFHCDKTGQARPFIKVFFKDDLDDKKYLQAAHTLSRQYIKEEEVPVTIQLTAIKKEKTWVIMKDDKLVLAENKRPIVALSAALKHTHTHKKQIKLCERLKTILKSTNKNNLSNEMKSAYKVIEDHKLLMNL